MFGAGCMLLVVSLRQLETEDERSKENAFQVNNLPPCEELKRGLVRTVHQLMIFLLARLIRDINVGNNLNVIDRQGSSRGGYAVIHSISFKKGQLYSWISGVISILCAGCWMVQTTRRVWQHVRSFHCYPVSILLPIISKFALY